MTRLGIRVAKWSRYRKFARDVLPHLSVCRVSQQLGETTHA